MKRRWPVAIGAKGMAEVVVTKDGGMTLEVLRRSSEAIITSTVVEMSEGERLEVIEALKAAGRSRAGITRTDDGAERT